MPRAIEQFLEISPLPGRLAPKDTLAGEAIIAKLTPAPGNNSPIGGLKAVVFNGRFAARPSGTENLYKIYAESFEHKAHLDAVVNEAGEMVNHALAS